jgi:hypothetical protein
VYCLRDFRRNLVEGSDGREDEDEGGVLCCERLGNALGGGWMGSGIFGVEGWHGVEEGGD